MAEAQEEIDFANEFLTLMGIPQTVPGSTTVLTLQGRLTLLREYINSLENVNIAYETAIASLRAISGRDMTPTVRTEVTRSIFSGLETIVAKYRPTQTPTNGRSR